MALLDSMLNGCTVTADGVGITISSLSSNEKAILTVALVALATARGEALSGGKAIGVDVGGVAGSGERHRIVVTPSAS